MWQSLKRWWKYLAVKLRVAHEEHADPKVQLEQALQEGKEQHRRLVEQAAVVVANQKQLQTRLDRTIDDYDKANRLAHQALLLADQGNASGDDGKVAKFNDAAEAAATKVLTLRGQIDDLEQQVLQATTQAENARVAVLQSKDLLERRLAEREKLLSELDRAKMQEAMNEATAVLTQSTGEDIPTFVEVQRKIEKRRAVADAQGELLAAQANLSLDGRLIELERTQASVEAQALLSQMRAEMGIREPKAIAPVRPVPEPPRVIELPREA